MWKALGAAALGAVIVLAGVAYGSRYAGTLINNQPGAAMQAVSMPAWPVIPVHTGITTTANGALIPMEGRESAVIQVVGITTATITFEGTVDGTNWVAIAAADLNSTTRARSTTATADGLYLIEPSGSLTSARARISAYTAGTLTVTARTY